MLKKFIIMATVLMTLSLSVLADESSEQSQTYKDKIPEFLSYLGERKEPIELSYRADSYNYVNKLFNETIDPTVNELTEKTIPLQRKPLSPASRYMSASFVYGFGKVYAVTIRIPVEDEEMLSYLTNDFVEYLNSNDWKTKCSFSKVLADLMLTHCGYKKDNYSIASAMNKYKTYNIHIMDSNFEKELEEKLKEDEEKRLQKQREKNMKIKEIESKESFNRFERAIQVN